MRTVTSVGLRGYASPVGPQKLERVVELKDAARISLTVSDERGFIHYSMDATKMWQTDPVHTWHLCQFIENLLLVCASESLDDLRDKFAQMMGLHRPVKGD